MLVQMILAAAFLLSTICAAAVPSLHGQDLQSGQAVTIDAGGEGLVTIFLSARCPCSDSHVAELAQLKADFPGFRFVGVHANRDEALDFTKAYFLKVALPFPIVEDQNSTLANQFKAAKTPHAFVQTGDGKIVYQGGVTDSHDAKTAVHKYLREALTDLHAKVAVRTPQARTLGCAISRTAR